MRPILTCFDRLLTATVGLSTGTCLILDIAASDWRAAFAFALAFAAWLTVVTLEGNG